MPPSMPADDAVELNLCCRPCFCYSLSAYLLTMLAPDIVRNKHVRNIVRNIPQILAKSLPGRLSSSPGRNSIEFAAGIAQNGRIWAGKWPRILEDHVLMVLCILHVFYKLLVACPLSRRGFFFGQKVRPRIFGPAFVRFCDFSLILGSQGSHIMIFNFYFWL